MKSYAIMSGILCFGVMLLAACNARVEAPVSARWIQVPNAGTCNVYLMVMNNGAGEFRPGVTVVQGPGCAVTDD